MIAKQPFLLLTLGLLAGIMIQIIYPQGQYYTSVSCISLLIATLLFRFYQTSRNKHRTTLFFFDIVCIFLFSASLGLFLTFAKQEDTKFTPPALSEHYSGYILEIPKVKKQTISTKLKLDNYDKTIICQIHLDSQSRQLSIGDHIQFESRLTPVKNFPNKNNFDYQKYLYYKGVVISTYISKNNWIKTDNKLISLYIKAQNIRLSLIEYLSTTLQLQGEDLALISAILLGYQENISDDLKDAFRISGTIHILSVSGLHTTLLYAFIVFILSRLPVLKRHRKLINTIVIAFLIFYASITGLSPSVVRASTMLIFLCIGDILGKSKNSLNNLFIVAFFMMVYNPFILMSIGFQLSFLAVLFLLVIYPTIATYSFQSSWIDTIWKTLLVSIVAQLATFPLVLYYFGTFPNYFFVANLFIVPYANLILSISFCLIILYSVTLLPIAGISAILVLLDFLNHIFIELNHLFINIVYFFAQLPYATSENAYTSMIETIIIYIIIGLGALSLKYHNSKLQIITLCILLSLILTDTTKLLIN